MTCCEVLVVRTDRVPMVRCSREDIRSSLDDCEWYAVKSFDQIIQFTLIDVFCVEFLPEKGHCGRQIHRMDRNNTLLVDKQHACCVL